MYAPGSSAQQDELVELCKVVARHGKVYATHMRSYSDQLLDSIEEQLLLARLSGCRLQISHLQAVGARNWDKQDRALERLEQARQEGIDIEFDSYPYLAGSTILTQLLPQEAVDGGIAALLALLAQPNQRQRIAEAATKRLAQRWSDIFIASVGSQRNQDLVGLSFEDLAQRHDVAPVEAAIDLLIEEKGIVNILSFNQSEENLRKLADTSALHCYQRWLLRKGSSASAALRNVPVSARRNRTGTRLSQFGGGSPQDYGQTGRAVFSQEPRQDRVRVRCRSGGF